LAARTHTTCPSVSEPSWCVRDSELAGHGRAPERGMVDQHKSSRREQGLLTMPQLTLSVLHAPPHCGACKVPATKGPSARVRARAVRQVTCASWKTAVTEAVTAVPIWIVTRLVDGLNQSADASCPQSQGVYEDPRQHACVKTCAAGWYWDEDTRSCVPDQCLTGFSWDEQDEFCLPSGGLGAAVSNVQPYNPVSNSNVDYFNYPRPRCPISPPTFSNAKFRSNIASATDDRKSIKCPPGYYVDPNNADACTPICKPGYTFDTHLKSCVSEV